jgi:N-acetylmuramoyl-L-alanine amidase
MTRRTIVLCFIGTIAAIGALSTHREAIGATSASVLMERASTCERRLLASPSLMKLRSSWERCIARYAATASAAPAHPLARTALQHQAELTLALSRRSGRRQDADTAERLAVRLRAWTADQTAAPDGAATSASGTRSSPAPLTRPGIRVIIDPGHGGKDPGAVGDAGVQEKDVVLDVAKRVRTVLSKDRRVTVILTRADDRFLPLEARTAFATARRADLFMSIHANSSPRRAATGVETYVLGGSSDEDARTTAERENTTLGQAAPNTTALIQAMLADLSDTTREEHSIALAHFVKESFVRTVGARYPVVDLGIKRAPFYVLLNTGMPSILAEIAFLSNPKDERRLAQSLFRQRVAEALAAGILAYAASPVMVRSAE